MSVQVFVWDVSRNPDKLLRESVLQACGSALEGYVFITSHCLIELRTVTPRLRCEEWRRI